MNEVLSLPFDRDTLMRRVARELAMDLYPLDQILENCKIDRREFDKWKDNPRFLAYLSQFKEEWSAASNAHERAKIKASIVMEEFMQEAYTSLHSNKFPLNHRVELGKLVAKIAGMGEPKVAAGGGVGSGFSLSINIGSHEKVTISQQPAKVIDHRPDDYDDYDPFSSPNTLDDE